MNFSRLSRACADIEELTSRTEITRILAKLLGALEPTEAAIVANLLSCQLRAPYRGTNFSLGQQHLTAVLARVLNISEQAAANTVLKKGDLGLAIPDTYRPQQDHEYSIEQVYNRLCEIEKLSGLGSQEEKIASVAALLTMVDYLSARLIIRIIMGQLRLGVSDMTFIDALSWVVAGDKSLKVPIEHSYNLCADLGYITYILLHNGIEKLVDMKPEVGIPIRPAAAERLPTAHAIFKKIGPCVAQLKLDGFRVQVHIENKNNIRFFSRNLLDMSDMFPELTHAFQEYSMNHVILEGEAIGYDQVTESFLPFQETVKRKRKHDIAEVAQEFPLKLFLFDALVINNRSMLSHTHEERRAALLKLVPKEEKSAIQVIGEVEISSEQDLEDTFLAAVSSGVEGIVVKKPQAVYQPGSRNFNWIKLKRHETGTLEDTLDVVIIGYYVGRGKRSHCGIGAVLCAVYNSVQDRFDTIAKIGTGLTDSEWHALKKTCDEYQTSHKLAYINCPEALTPDVWVAPQLVCAVRADEITRSPIHSAGYALRFPRFMDMRKDKSPTDATTVNEIIKLFKDQRFVHAWAKNRAS